MTAAIRRALPAVWYVALAVLVTWPLATDPFSRLGALSGPGDPYLNLWILGWDLQTLTRAPADLVTGRVFNAAIFHPARQTLAYSDHLLPIACGVWPLYALTGSLVLAYNAVLLVSLVAAALAMHALAHRLTGSTAGALAAGTIWGFWPYHTAHLGHLQLQALYAMPLAWLALHRLVAGRRRRDAMLLGVAVAFMAATSVYYGVIGAIGLAVSTIVLVVSTGGRRAGRLAGRLLLAGIVAVLLTAPFVWPYWQVQQREGFVRNLYEAARHAATPGSYWSAPEVNLLYGASGWLRTDRGAESELFVGFAALALAGIGVFVARRRGSWPVAVSAMGLVMVGFVLSLGPDGVRLLYATLHRWVFGFQAIRAPARFGVLVAFGVAMLAALGMREIARWTGRRRLDSNPRPLALPVPCAIALLLVAGEYVNRPLPLTAVPALTTAVGEWLRSAPDSGAVLYLPLRNDFENTPFMVEALLHGRPIVNGYSGQRPAFFSGVVDTLHDFPSSEAMWTLNDLEVRYVVSPAPVDTAVWPLVERARLTDPRVQPSPRYVYELVWSEEVEQRLGPLSTPKPPPPGPIALPIRERLDYRVTWEAPGGPVAAGTLTLTIEPAAAVPSTMPAVAGGVHRFTAIARTAPWIARFFEADDRFVTTTDGTLRPLLHERSLREGRRVVDQSFAFDATALEMRTLTPDGQAAGPAVRMWPDARDGVSALFYVRTLNLQPGHSIELPVIENGRNQTLAIDARATERLESAGRSWEATRMDVVLKQRVPRRTPPQVTVWLAREAPCPLLAAEVRAAFGNLRIELDRPASGS